MDKLQSYPPLMSHLSPCEQVHQNKAAGQRMKHHVPAHKEHFLSSINLTALGIPIFPPLLARFLAPVKMTNWIRAVPF